VVPRDLTGITEPAGEPWIEDRSGRGVETTTVEVLVSRAVARAARIAALRARVTAAKAGVEAAWAPPNPEFRVTQIRAREFRDGHAPMDFALRARFPRLGEPGVKEAIARADLRECESDLWAAGWAVEIEVRRLLTDAILLEREVGVAQRMAQLQSQLCEVLQRRMNQGASTDVEAALQDLERQEASERAAELKGRRRVVMEALSLRTGVSSIDLPPLEAVLPGPARALDDLPDRETAVSTALSQSPELEEAAARLDRAAAAVWFEKAKQWPWFSFVQGGCEVDQGGRYDEIWTAGVALDLPVFFWTNRAAVRCAEAAQRQAELDLDAVAGGIVADVQSRWERLRASARSLDDAVSGSAKGAERAVTAVENALEVGQADSMEVLGVKARQAEVELRILGLLRRYCDASLNMLDIEGRTHRTGATD